MQLVTPQISIVENQGRYVKLMAEPLAQGFGTTLGNAMRRVLLSSLPGAAITAVRIDQVQHEFSTIPHVKEDAIDLLLNIKEVRLQALSDRPGRLFLDVSGQREVTAGDIQCPPDYEVINPELHLATLDSPEARLTIEFTVEQGRGWTPAGSADGLPIGVIPVDAIFTPIEKVSYNVESSRVGQYTNYERLILEVWTDGSIDGVEAISQSADILVNQFSLFRHVGRPQGAMAERGLGSGIVLSPERYNTPIEDLNLSVRAYNCLKRSGLTTVGQVLELTEEDLMALRNFGRKSFEELKDRLIELGFLPAGEERRRELAGEYEEEEEMEEGVDPRLRQLLRLRKALGDEEEETENEEGA